MAAYPTGEDHRPPVLIYDGACRLCVATKERLEGSGPACSTVRFVPYDSDEARVLLGTRYRSGRQEMAFLVDSSGRVREGIQAFLPFASDLPGGPVVLMLLRFPFGMWVATRVYRMIARFRYRWFGAVHERPFDRT